MLDTEHHMYFVKILLTCVPLKGHQHAGSNQAKQIKVRSCSGEAGVPFQTQPSVTNLQGG